MRLFLLLLVSLALPDGLVYAFGWWSLVVCAALVVALCMVSVRPGSGIEATRSGALTRYDTGMG